MSTALPGDVSDVMDVMDARSDGQQDGGVAAMTANKKKNVTRDGFGFAVPTPYISLYRDFRVVYDIEERNRIKSWTTWLEGYEGCLDQALEAARAAKHASKMRSTRKKHARRGGGGGDGGDGGGGDGRGRDDDGAGPTDRCVTYHELRVLVKAGVPKGMRRAVWQACLVDEVLLSDMVAPGVDGSNESAGDRMVAGYRSLVKRMEDAEFQEDMQQIEKDLHRTFPNHALTNTAGGRARLRRVLGAYAVRNPLVGYCQGLNFIAATFLLIFVDHESSGEGGEGGEEAQPGGGTMGETTRERRMEENEAAAFWCFVALVEQILTGYFDPMMINQQVDGLVFEQLVREVLPEVAVHFDDVGVHVPTAVAGWFLVVFVNSLPSEATMRVWDVMFFEKSPSVLFWVGIGLLSVYKEAIVECRNDSDCYMLVQSIGPITFNANALVEAMEDFVHIKGSVVQVLRDKYAPGVTKVMEKMFDGGRHGEKQGGSLVSGAAWSSGGSSFSNASAGSSRGSSRSQGFVTNAMSMDIEKRLGILRLRHKDSAAALGHSSQDVGQDQQRMTQESLRRTQSALTDSTPGIVLQGRNERLQQQLRINLLAMRTFVPDMKLLTTALQIASGNTRDDDSGQAHGGGQRGALHGVNEAPQGLRGDVSGQGQDINMTNHGEDESKDKKREEDLDSTPMRGTASNAKTTPVPRRFTDGGALLASPFKQGGPGGVAVVAGLSGRGTPATVGMDSLPNATASGVSSTQAQLSAQTLPLEKLLNIDSVKAALSTEVMKSVNLLDEISASNLQLEDQVSEIGDQLAKVQEEIVHKVSTYDALFQRAHELQDQTHRVEVTYRKQLASNLQLADTWRAISKEIKKNDTTLKLLMELAESRSAPSELSSRGSEPNSPTKKFKLRASAMVNRKFTR